MNKLLRDLAGAADAYAVHNFHKRDETFQETFERKYADLIIKHCMSVCDDDNAQKIKNLFWD